MSIKKEIVNVSNMHCTSCENIIENSLKKLNGVLNVDASFSKSSVEVEYDSDLCNINTIKNSIVETGYAIIDTSTSSNQIRSLAGIIVIGVLILFLGNFSGSFNMSSKLNGNVTYMILFVVGIFTSIHCLGMCGGIMLSQSISSNAIDKLSSFKRALSYNVGRVISYTILGGIIGGIGSIFNISLHIKSAIMILAGIFMVIMGLNMFGFSLFRKLNIVLPWSSCKIKNRTTTPFLVGILNGLMPCGPLQTMQLYALGTGSIATGALSMFMFSIGTVPLMLGFGTFAGLLSRKFTNKILKLSSILIILLGVIMSNRGLNLLGVGVSPMSKLNSQKNLATSGVKAEIKDGVQTINITADSNGYTPSTVFVQKGIPVNFIINGKTITSCNSEIVVPSLDIQKELSEGKNIIKFTPKEIGDINYSCWMGMLNGVIKVVDTLDSTDISKVKPIQSSQSGCCSQ